LASVPLLLPACLSFLLLCVRPLLQLLTLLTLGVWATRLVLGYLRMDDRYKSIVAQLLAGEGGLCVGRLGWRAHLVSLLLLLLMLLSFAETLRSAVPCLLMHSSLQCVLMLLAASVLTFHWL
jgi:hypothetical protein